MRKIRRSSRFEQDYKRASSGRYRQALMHALPEVLTALLNDQPLAPSIRDHSLTGDWTGYRDCHTKPDLVLIYKKTDEELLLARLGSYSQLDL